MAVNWWRLAAERNNPLGQFNLGLCCANGEGVAKSTVEAYKWFSLASVNGNDKAKNHLENLVKNMSPEQISDGQNLVNSFKPSTGFVVSKDATAFINTGRQKMQAGDIAGAVAAFSKAIDLAPESPSAYNQRGHAEFLITQNGSTSNGSLESALADFNKAIALAPDFASAYYNRGMVMKVRGNVEGATADFTKVVGLNPELTLMGQAYYNLGLLKQQEGDKVQANSFFAGAFFCRGTVEANQGDTNGALADFSKSIEFKPDSFQSYYNRGILKDRIADAEGALADYNKAISLSPNDAGAYNNRGGVRAKNGDLNGALADFDRAIQLNPNFVSAYMNRAISKKKKGDLEGSLSDQNKALELSSKTQNPSGQNAKP
jgi:tetratricopeptide (TPR) repeat protein